MLAAATIAHDRLADDEAFGEGHAGARAELRVAAFDQLAERAAVSRVRDGVRCRGANWLAMAGERLALAIVVRRDIDDERRRGARR